jgi:hypothetical protein
MSAILIILMALVAQAENVVTITPDAVVMESGVLAGGWRVEEEAIVGRAEAGERAWLRLPGEFWDVAIELEFMTPSPANGGVQVRGHWLPVSPETALEPKTMYGYHVNIDTGAPGKTGEILIAHGEPRAGRLEPVADPRRRFGDPGRDKRRRCGNRLRRDVYRRDGRAAGRGGRRCRCRSALPEHPAKCR